MSAAQQARIKSKRDNQTIYGILSDGVMWWFAILTNESKLYVSYTPLLLTTEENLVVTYLDQILLHAIHSSKHTTLVKRQNRTLRGYNLFLRQTWRLGLEPGKEETEDSDEEQLPVNIIL